MLNKYVHKEAEQNVLERRNVCKLTAERSVQNEQSSFQVLNICKHKYLPKYFRLLRPNSVHQLSDRGAEDEGRGRQYCLTRSSFLAMIPLTLRILRPIIPTFKLVEGFLYIVSNLILLSRRALWLQCKTSRKAVYKVSTKCPFRPTYYVL